MSRRADWQATFESLATQARDSVTRNGFVSVRNTLALRRVVRELAGPLRGARVLDAGCGDGAVSAHMSSDNRVVGLDFSPNMLGHARRAGLLPVRADMTRPPFAEQRFDLVLSVEAATLTPDCAATLTGLGRLVAPQGRLVASILNARSLVRRAAEWLLRLAGRSFPASLSLAEMQAAIAAGGLTVEDGYVLIALPGLHRIKPLAAVAPWEWAIVNNIVLAARRPGTA